MRDLRRRRADLVDQIEHGLLAHFEQPRLGPVQICDQQDDRRKHQGQQDRDRPTVPTRSQARFVRGSAVAMTGLWLTGAVGLRHRHHFFVGIFQHPGLISRIMLFL